MAGCASWDCQQSRGNLHAQVAVLMGAHGGHMHTYYLEKNLWLQNLSLTCCEMKKLHFTLSDIVEQRGSVAHAQFTHDDDPANINCLSANNRFNLLVCCHIKCHFLTETLTAQRPWSARGAPRCGFRRNAREIVLIARCPSRPQKRSFLNKHAVVCSALGRIKAVNCRYLDWRKSNQGGS